MSRLLTVLACALGFVVVGSVIGLAMSFGWRPWTWLTITGVISAGGVLIAATLMRIRWGRSLERPEDVQKETDRMIHILEAMRRKWP